MTIQKEIKQTRPFRSSSQEAAVALMRTVDLLKRRLGSVVETSGITLQQYNVLRILRGSHPDSLLTLEISGRMIEQAPGITRLLDRLERRELIRRERCSSDRRRVHCWITDEGLRILEELDPAIDTADDVIGSIGEKNVETLLDLLSRIRKEL